jgi:hypothetical protein
MFPSRVCSLSPKKTAKSSGTEGPAAKSSTADGPVVGLRFKKVNEIKIVTRVTAEDRWPATYVTPIEAASQPWSNHCWAKSFGMVVACWVAMAI